ncbi:hypothetical protein ZHAS_00017126 [Anopheles sinensis]|uniref:Uncharacterized protein n=1 Tax=Anopheles sinensis TaxID=74873 RepID=A0A084WF72_ANOSI|nr:hypothetical protein ZHAS_00017126 [Anopheles sinensis]
MTPTSSRFASSGSARYRPDTGGGVQAAAPALGSSFLARHRTCTFEAPHLTRYRLWLAGND